MSSYTMELGTLLRWYHATPSNSWEDAWPYVGLANYPIYQETHRAALNERILRHYYFNEIGLETPQLFAAYLDGAMQDIMPYYNKLYLSSLIDIKYLVGSTQVDVESIARDLSRATTKDLDRTVARALENAYKRDQDQTSTSSDNSTTNSNSTTTVKNLDTPQNRFENIEDGYLTNASITSNSSTDNTNSTSNETNTNDISDTSNENENTTTNEDTKGTQTDDEDTKRNLTIEKTDPAMYRQLLTIGRQLLDIDAMIVEDNAIRTCFMSVL